jgi:hypothetical protein
LGSDHPVFSIGIKGMSAVKRGQFLGIFFQTVRIDLLYELLNFRIADDDLLPKSLASEKDKGESE